MLLAGRPGLIDIVARVGERRAHFVAGLRGVADQPHFLRAGDESALGLLDDEDGLAVRTDVLRDAQLAALLLAVVRGVAPRPGPVAVLRETSDATVLDCGDRGDLLFFPWLDAGLAPDVDLMVALEGIRLQPHRRPAGALDLGAERSRGGARAAGRPLRGLGARPDVAPRLLRGRRRTRGRRRRLRGRGPGTGHHDGPDAPGARPRLPARARAGGGLGRSGRSGDRRGPTRRCWTHRASTELVEVAP